MIRKLVLTALLLGAAYKYAHVQHGWTWEAPPALDDLAASLVAKKKPQADGRFVCDGRRYCSQMNSRDEAEYFHHFCPETRMDGNHNDVPCEDDTRF